MARLTLAAATAQLASQAALLDAKDAEIAALKAKLAEQLDTQDFVSRAEYNRVQGVLRTTQLFLRKYKAEAKPATEITKRPFRERCLAYFKATGANSVTPSALLAWEQAHAQ